MQTTLISLMYRT